MYISQGNMFQIKSADLLITMFCFISWLSVRVYGRRDMFGWKSSLSYCTSGVTSTEMFIIRLKKGEILPAGANIYCYSCLGFLQVLIMQGPMVYRVSSACVACQQIRGS
jgi:hypothetical protein